MNPAFASRTVLPKAAIKMTIMDISSITRSVVAVRAVIPEEAFTSGALGTEREGSASSFATTVWCSPSVISSPKPKKSG
jgi:hypothetical protein